MTPARSRLFAALCLLLAGCGAETVGSAAVAAKAGQEEVREGQKLQEDLANKIDAAARLERQKLDEAAQDSK